MESVLVSSSKTKCDEEDGRAKKPSVVGGLDAILSLLTSHTLKVLFINFPIQSGTAKLKWTGCCKSQDLLTFKNI